MTIKLVKRLGAAGNLNFPIRVIAGSCPDRKIVSKIMTIRKNNEQDN